MLSCCFYCLCVLFCWGCFCSARLVFLLQVGWLWAVSALFVVDVLVAVGDGCWVELHRSKGCLVIG